MAVERTISIIKPDAVGKNVIGEIYSRFEKAGLKVIAAKMMHLSQEKAGAFYEVHKERPFYNDLVSFMTSGPVMVQVLEGEGAIAKNREVMGATNPAKPQRLKLHSSLMITSCAREPARRQLTVGSGLRPARCGEFE